MCLHIDEVIKLERKSGDAAERGREEHECVCRSVREDRLQCTKESVHLGLEQGHQERSDRGEGRMREDRYSRLPQFSDLAWGIFILL